jgi:hypothetical protein
MRTTTVVFQFDPETSAQVLDKKVELLRRGPKTPLDNFFLEHGVSATTNTIVSEDVSFENSLRTVVRSWDTVELATAWIALTNAHQTTSAYPGHVISAQVDPE